MGLSVATSPIGLSEPLTGFDMAGKATSPTMARTAADGLRAALCYVLSNAHLGTDGALLKAHMVMPVHPPYHAAPFAAAMAAANALLANPWELPPRLAWARDATNAVTLSTKAAAEAAVLAAIHSGAIPGIRCVPPGPTATDGSKWIARVDARGAPVPLPHVAI